MRRYFLVMCILLFGATSNAKSGFEGLDYDAGVAKYTKAVCAAKAHMKACRDRKCKKGVAALTVIIMQDFSKTYGQMPPESAETGEKCK